MPTIKTEIISLKKLKKDGSVDRDVFKKIVSYLKAGNVVIIPVDCIYGVLCTSSSYHLHDLIGLSYESPDKLIALISNFKMLESMATVSKFLFDFLHRVWPGELTVYLKGKNPAGKPVAVRMPRNKFKLDIIDELNVPVYFAAIHNAKGKQIFREKDILAQYMGKVGLIVVIHEFCKVHPFPSVVDLTKNELHVILEGRISEEEIKSLYFLGKDENLE